jgi:hypothetical protein
MSEPGCPYLVRERITYRESLDLTRAASTTVIVTWYCSHPFHGIRLELGTVAETVADHCAACALPRQTTAGDRVPCLRPGVTRSRSGATSAG